MAPRWALGCLDGFAPHISCNVVVNVVLGLTLTRRVNPVGLTRKRVNPVLKTERRKWMYCCPPQAQVDVLLTTGSAALGLVV